MLLSSCLVHEFWHMPGRGLGSRRKMLNHGCAPALGRSLCRCIRRGAAAALVVGLSGGAVAASQGPPWVADNDTPLPTWVKSARVLKRDQPLFDAPGASPRRRGSVDRSVD